MEDRLQEFLDLFRKTAAYLESPELAQAFEAIGGSDQTLGPLEKLGLTAMVWTARQLRAISLLLENDMALQGEPVIRALLELTISVAWVGKDVDRAEQLRDDGLASMQTWVASMEAESPGFFTAAAKRSVEEMVAKSTGKAGRLPNLRDRAAHANPPNYKQGLTKRLYEFSYRRLSAATHVDTRAFDALVHPTDAMPRLDAQETAVAASVVIRCCADVLGLMPQLAPLTMELFRLAQDSRAWPRPGSS